MRLVIAGALLASAAGCAAEGEDADEVDERLEEGWLPRVGRGDRLVEPARGRDVLVMNTDDADSVGLHVEARDEVGRQERWREQLDAMSVPLSVLRNALGGDDGALLDEFGRAHPVSLAPWADRDPSTRLLFHFTFQQRDAPPGLNASVYFGDVLARLVPPS
jgi:hypothetical protein